MPLIVAIICFTALGAAAKIAAHDDPSGWTTTVAGMWTPVRLALLLVAIYLFLGVTRRQRPARFILTRRGFGVPNMPTHRLALALVIYPTAASPIADVVTSLRDGQLGPKFWIGAAILLILVPFGVVILLWSRHPIQLTPAGIEATWPTQRRTIPWDALTPGTPRRPLPAGPLPLDVTRPDLVTQRGLWPGSGPRHQPKLPRTLDIHPRLLADAIRWYAEHPADRAGIGTQSELDALAGRLPATATAA